MDNFGVRQESLHPRKYLNIFNFIIEYYSWIFKVSSNEPTWDLKQQIINSLESAHCYEVNELGTSGKNFNIKGYIQ